MTVIVWPSFWMAIGETVPVTMIVSSLGLVWARAGAPASRKLATIVRQEGFRYGFTLTSPMMETVHTHGVSAVRVHGQGRRQAEYLPFGRPIPGPLESDCGRQVS